MEVKAESFKVRNVIGIIHGKDTTRSIIIGAHYDHLGIRDKVIYNGADDNASGTAGMLALAKIWSECNQPPDFNLIFAAWTAEEKGLLGSSYFAEHESVNPSNTLVNINLDMISRNDVTDTTGLQLSIGTLKGSDELKKLATVKNSLLQHPFILDLWESTGSGGSDYAPFAARKVPIMTFFSGYHKDYHTQHDTFAKADLSKMKSILMLVNSCLYDILNGF